MSVLKEVKVRVDLESKAISGSEKLFTDGCCFKHETGGLRAVYAVVKRELVEALSVPKKVAIVKCKGHDTANTVIARGNQEADRAAKTAAGYHSHLQLVSIEEETKIEPKLTTEIIKQYQKGASPQEKKNLETTGGNRAGRPLEGARRENNTAPRNQRESESRSAWSRSCGSRADEQKSVSLVASISKRYDEKFCEKLFGVHAI